MENNKKARVIAFYLPQYHPIPENDKWWGKGFTEWTNVAKAKPLFRGHYQPKLPADLGFYDLRLPQIREQQADMAREAGIEGFMYWHYWFGNGKMLLEKPFEEVLSSGKPDFPFCLGWANHSWSTKTWQKGKVLSNDTMILEQLYLGKEDDIKHFHYLLPAFKDSRYLKIDGKPIFVIYSPSVFPKVDEFIKLWQSLAKKNGLPGIHFVGLVLSRVSLTKEKLFELGFDAVNKSNFNMWEAECKTVRSIKIKRLKSLIAQKLGIPLQRYNYKHIIKHLCDEDDFDENVYPTILPNYDRTARAGAKSVIYYNNTPELFGKHVDDVLNHVKNKKTEKQIVFLKSWNEWGEGNYIEPDMKYGHSFLDVLQKRIDK